MEIEQAKRLITETFESPFDKGRFTNFVKNLLNNIEESTFTYKGNYIPDAYKQYISTLERVGKYTDGQNKIDILIAKLKRETSIERARTMQRNFIAWYLNGSRGGDLKDAALVAFVSPNEEDYEEDWRFSLVKMDYIFKEDTKGRTRVKQEFTPARRWSFLVGVNEKSHTAKSRLVPILVNDETNPTLKDLEEAFNIEKVTKEFFEKYRELFIRTKDALDKVINTNSKVKEDFNKKKINSVDFAKKLLGQIVFLYFLQKKGWFGVERDKDWGTGSKKFLRELFDGKHCKYQNFFNDILEPLFYEALRLNRKHDDDYYSRFNCKIPFLNGGLFDPINDYDWVHTDIILRNDRFSNQHKTKEGDTGDGILDIFDRYNFTVKEDEPLEKEVAIDPEMLGKAYEKFNAIRPDNYDEYSKTLKSGKKGEETKFNKQFGVYYTPREIVHYMCQQSLIYYLHSELNNGTVSYQALDEKQLSVVGNQGKKGQHKLTIEHKSNDKVPLQDIETLIKYGEQVGENEARVESEGKETDTYYYKLPESIRKNTELIDEKLANIKVCDPAVGSGAFLVGMMTEIVKTRNVLSSFIKKPNRAIYDFKRECIEKSLYGVDIDSGAVEIAKFRLWLSLIVDEEDYKNIKPLPNLDYKVVCGNSLLFYPYRPTKLEIIENLKDKFINETQPEEKTKLKQQIDCTLSEFFQNSKKMVGYDITFDFNVNFSEVFREKKGFDIVIANPPYVEGRHLTHNDLAMLKKLFFSAQGKVNLFNLFLERAHQIIPLYSICCFIIPKTFLINERYWAIRQFLLKNSIFLELVEFDEMQFEAVIVENILIIFKKSETVNNSFPVYKNLSTKPCMVLPQLDFLKQTFSKIITTSDQKNPI